MKEFFLNIKSRYFDPDKLSIRLVLFNIITSAGIIGGTISLLLTFAINSNPLQFIAIIMAIIVLFAAFYIANEKRKVKIASILIVGVITLVLFPIMFFTGGGTYSGMSSWFAIGVLFSFLLIDGVHLCIMVVLQFLAIILCFLADYFFPEMISPLDGKLNIAIDMVQSLMVLSVCIGAIFRFQNKVYKHSMEQLEQARKEADAANKSKSAFLASMSHEIRTPINAVLGMNELILRESKEQNVLNYASNAYNSGNALLSLINDILDFSKIEAGRLEITESEYDLYSLISDCCHMTSNRAEKKGLAFRISCDEKLPSRLKGDMFHIRQVAVNFITNAVKYTDKGEVTLEISGETHNDELKLRICVKDTGIGIRPENLDKLFTSFQRFDLERNQTVEGTGLGLSICKQLSELMGGSVSAKSVYGEGSSFICEIPQKIVDPSPVGRITLDSISEQISIDRRSGFTAPEARILVVDDVEMNLFVFTSFLKGHKMHIDTALSGKICLELAAENSYDIIFMDHMMPEMDGIETFRELRRRKLVNFHTPVVMLTANAIYGEKEKYLSEGFASYLTKPIQSDRLEHALLELLPKEKIILGEKVSEKPIPEDSAPDASGNDILDTVLGLRYNGGSREIYFKVLGMYAKNGSEKKELIQKLLEKESWKDYTTEVHALKSTSLMIGARQLSENAKELETAGKEGKYDIIKEKNGALLELYQRVLDAADSILSAENAPSEKPSEPQDVSLSEISRNELEGYLNEIISCCGNYDCDEIARLCSIMEKSSYNGSPLGKKACEIKNLSEDFEYDEAMKKTEELKKEFGI